jgi:hypothetical protein
MSWCNEIDVSDPTAMVPLVQGDTVAECWPVPETRNYSVQEILDAIKAAGGEHKIKRI